MRSISLSLLLLVLVLPQSGFAQGQPTTLGGFYAAQTNQCIRTSSNGRIDVIFSASDDSISTQRKTQYACSTDGGNSWNNFSSIRVPNRSSGHPALETGKGTIGNGVIIADHSIVTSTPQSTAFIDYPAGDAAFSELAPPMDFGADNPIDPYVASAADGSILLYASRVSAGTCYITRSNDYISW